MPDLNTTSCRLQTLCNTLLDQHHFGDPWLADFWRQSASTRPGVASKRPPSLGALLSVETHRARSSARHGIGPPAAFLRWLLEHPDEMTVADNDAFGAKNEEVRAWRRRLFASNLSDGSAAKSEGMR